MLTVIWWLKDWNILVFIYSASCFSLFYSMAMASACGQLCMRCRGSLSSKTAVWQCYSHVRHLIPRTRQLLKSFDGLFITKRLASTQTGLSWKQQMCCYSDLAEKHLTADAKDNKHTKELTKTSITQITNTLMPSTDVLSMTEHPAFLGECWHWLFKPIWIQL